MSTPPEHTRAIANLESVGCKWEASVLRRLHAANLDCVDHFDAVRAERDELLAALRIFVGAACPVSTDIDPRGHSWSEAYLDQALEFGRKAIKKVSS